MEYLRNIEGRVRGSGARPPRPTRHYPPLFPYVFLIYSIKSRSGHDQSQTFDSIVHVSGPKLRLFEVRNFILVLHGFASRNPKNIVFPLGNAIFK